jgi:hypothetical protein
VKGKDVGMEDGESEGRNDGEHVGDSEISEI